MSTPTVTTARPWHSIPPLRSVQRLPLAAFLVRLLPALAALVFGAIIVGGRPLLAAAPLAGLAVFFLSRSPVLPYLTVVIVIATFAEPYAFPQFNFAGINPFLSEVIFGLALTAGFLSLPRVRGYLRHAPRTIGILLSLFLLTVVGGLAVGAENGTTLHVGILDMRPFVFFAAFWLALVALAQPRSRRTLLKLAVLLALAVVALQLAQMAVGTGRILFYTKDPLVNLTTCPQGQCADPSLAGFIRVRPPGLRLVYIVCAFSLCYLLWAPRRRRIAAAGIFAITLTGVAASLNRNQLIGLVAGIVVAAVVVPRKQRVVTALLLAICLAFVVVPIAQSGVLGRDNTVSTIVKRIESLGGGSSLGEAATVKDRQLENHLAWQKIKQHPIEGIGWATPYGKTVGVLVHGQQVRTVSQPFIHDFYLGLWMRTGLIGLLSYLTVIAVAILYGIRWCRSRRWDDRSWLGAGVIASLVAVSVSVLVDPGGDPEKVVPLAGVLALAVLLMAELRQEQATAHHPTPGAGSGVADPSGPAPVA
jgi:O-antigen ligase